jgi:hypothetical protein
LQLQINFVQKEINMKHSMMRVAVAATLGFAALAANAGTIAVNVGATLAAEYVTAAATPVIPSLTFATANLLVANTAVTVHVRLSAGTVAAPTVAPVVNNGGTATVPVLDTDGKGYYFTVTAPATGLPAGTTITVSGAPATAATNGTVTGASLAAALSNGGTVSASVGYTSTVGDFSGVSAWIETPVSAVVLQSTKHCPKQYLVLV